MPLLHRLHLKGIRYKSVASGRVGECTKLPSQNRGGMKGKVFTVRLSEVDPVIWLFRTFGEIWKRDKIGAKR